MIDKVYVIWKQKRVSIDQPHVVGLHSSEELALNWAHALDASSATDRYWVFPMPLHHV